MNTSAPRPVGPSAGSPADLPALRRAVAALEPVAAGAGRFALGSGALDSWLGGGLARGAVHEVYAGQAHHPGAPLGFALALAARAACGGEIAWVRPDAADAGAGRPCGAGLSAFGLDPGRALVVRARDPDGLLRAAGEVARCAGLGAALVEVWGAPRALDLTLSRRLALAAGASGVTLVLVRVGAEPAPSAAASRWRVEAAASRPLEAGAPGRPAFAIALLRHRSGLGPRAWNVEWDRDSARFANRDAILPARGSAASPPVPALPGPAVPDPADGPAAAADHAGAGRAGGAALPRRRAG